MPNTKGISQLYWKTRMNERMPYEDEVCRLTMILKGFYLDEQENYSTLVEFAENSGRPYGNKDIASSIAFNLGWDRDRVLMHSSIPKWVEFEAMLLHKSVIDQLYSKFSK